MSRQKWNAKALRFRFLLVERLQVVHIRRLNRAALYPTNHPGGDASLVVGEISDLLKPEPRKVYVGKLKAAQEEIRVRFEKRDSDSARMLSLEESRQGIDPKLDHSAQPTWDGPLSSIVEESPSTEVITSYIDWSPFFWTWEFKGSSQQFSNTETMGGGTQALR